MSLVRFLRLSTQAILFYFSRSCLCMFDRCLVFCWAAGHWLHGGLGMSEVELDGWQEKSKRSTPLHVSKRGLLDRPTALYFYKGYKMSLYIFMATL
jgi:hypothetical protein